jgi:hypothetical protein
LDENLLPAVLDSLNAIESVNITMGFPLKNLSFSNAIKKLFYLQKQQEKNRLVITTPMFYQSWKNYQMTKKILKLSEILSSQ